MLEKKLQLWSLRYWISSYSSSHWTATLTCFFNFKFDTPKNEGNISLKARLAAFFFPITVLMTFTTFNVYHFVVLLSDIRDIEKESFFPHFLHFHTSYKEANYDFINFECLSTFQPAKFGRSIRFMFRPAAFTIYLGSFGKLTWNIPIIKSKVSRIQ